MIYIHIPCVWRKVAVFNVECLAEIVKFQICLKKKQKALLFQQQIKRQPKNDRVINNT